MKYEIKDETRLHSFLLTSGAKTIEGQSIDYFIQLAEHCKGMCPGAYKRIMGVYSLFINEELKRMKNNDRA